MAAVEEKHEKKVELTITTLSGDFEHRFDDDETLQAVVDETIKHLKLVGEGPWVLEFNGVELPLGQTIEQAKLDNGNVLTLNPQEGGGGSERE
jgi:hypothetical protein